MLCGGKIYSKYLYLCLTVFCFAFYSCNNSEGQKGVLQVDAHQRNDVVYSFDGAQVVLRLFIDGDKIIAQTLQEPFFSIIDIEGKKILESFGRKGRARNEFAQIPQGVNYRNEELQYFDFATKTLVKISANGSEFDAVPVPYDVGFRPFRMAEINDKLVAVGGFQEGSLAVVDPLQHFTVISDYSFDIGSLQGINRGTVIQSEVVTAPEKDKFLQRTFASDCFEIYEVNGNTIEKVFANDYKYPPVIENNKLNPRLSRAGYIRCFADDEYIYLLYSEETYQDSSNRGLLSNIIHKFDWNGNLVQILNLPEEIGAFCVKDTVVFGTVEYPDHSEIVEYMF